MLERPFGEETMRVGVIGIGKMAQDIQSYCMTALLHVPSSATGERDHRQIAWRSL